MIIYSKKIIQFVNEIRCVAKDILFKEVCVKVAGNRFYDQQQMASYPLSIVIYNNKSILGYFDSDFYELGFHECLMRSSKEQLHNVIRHELAHYMTFINYGETVQAHGAEFRSFCQRTGWGEEVYQAAFCLENGQDAAFEEIESGIFRKIQKLMALASSSNKNEAEQAIIKSQQLLLKHNIESKQIGEIGEEKIFLKRILKQKKENAKMRSIAKILETFFVSTVYHRGADHIYLEILGDAVNVEIAEHVANVLHHELDNLWKQAQQQHVDLKGAVAKNSFFQGLAIGYCNKIQALKRDGNSDVANALMVIEKKLIAAQAMAYPRLSPKHSSAQYCKTSATLGEQMGRQLNINPAINRSAKNSETLISHCPR